MHGPPITQREVEAVLRAEVNRLTRRGVSRSIAIAVVAEEHGLDPEWVESLVDSVDQMMRGEQG